jgi:signal peptidase I
VPVLAGGTQAHADAAGAEAAGAEADAQARSWLRRQLPLALGILVVALLLVARTFVAEPMRIPSDSMAPTLRPGDQVLVDKLAYRGSAVPARGDLAVFHDPRTGEVMLKRVVAVAGDTVGIEDGSLVVNGRRPFEPYADQKSIDSVYFGPVKVGAGRFFVLGDNRANSVDSRSFGSVPSGRLIGRVLTRLWPISR